MLTESYFSLPPLGVIQKLAMNVDLKFSFSDLFGGEYRSRTDDPQLAKLVL